MKFPASLKPFVFTILCLLGVHHLFRWWNGNKLLVLMYHGFRPSDPDGTPSSWLLVPTNNFEKQLAYLSKWYRIIHVSDAIERWEKFQSLPGHTCCLTFDDGYRNNLELAWPLLEKYDAPATIYLVTGLVGTAEIHWTVMLERAFLTTTENSLDLSDFDLPVYDLADPDCSIDLTARVYRCHGSDRQKVLTATFERLGLDESADFSGFMSMSWAEAKVMQESGLVEFGGHTVSHTVVSALDDDTQRQEIVGSMEQVGEHLGWPVVSFAYPNGTIHDFDDRAKLNVRKSGARAAFSTIRGLNDSTTDRYALRRVHVSNETGFAEFKLRTSGFLSLARQMLGLPE